MNGYGCGERSVQENCRWIVWTCMPWLCYLLKLLSLLLFDSMVGDEWLMLCERRGMVPFVRLVVWNCHLLDALLTGLSLCAALMIFRLWITTRGRELFQ